MEMFIEIMHIRVRVHFGLSCTLVWSANRAGMKLRLGRISHKGGIRVRVI